MSSEEQIRIWSAEARRNGTDIEAVLRKTKADTLGDLAEDQTRGSYSRTIHMIDLFAVSPEKFPTIGWLVDKLVQRRGLWILAGLPKRGKSLLRRLVAVCVALGKPFFGHEVRQGKVLMLIDEDELADEWQAMVAMTEALGGSVNDLRGKVFVVPPQRVQIDKQLDMAALRRLIREIDPVVVFIDPMVRYHGRDENEAHQMQDVLRPLAELGRERCIAVVHHTDKEGREPRGTGDLLASYKTLWRVRAKEGNVTKIDVSVTLKAGPTPEPLKIGFVFNDDGSIEIEEQEAADKLQSVKAKVLKALRQQEFPNRTALAKHVGGKRQKAFEAVNELLEAGRINKSADGALALPNTAPVPSSALKESGTLGTTTEQSVPEPMKNQSEPQELTGHLAGTGAGENSQPESSDGEEPNSFTQVCQIGAPAAALITED